MEPNDSSNIKHTPPNGNGNEQTTPPPGPPKKGFWGFIASFFPKDHPMADSKPSSESEDPAQHQTPESPVNAGQNSSSKSQTSQQQSSTPQQSSDAESDKQEPPVSGAPDVNQSELPQTDEEGGPNADGDKAPPTLPTPQSVKASAPEENEGNPETLPTEPEASGGSADDDSTPDPGEPYDPKQK